MVKAILGSIASLRSAWTVSVEQRILSLRLAVLILTLYNRTFLNPVANPVFCDFIGPTVFSYLSDPQSLPSAIR